MYCSDCGESIPADSIFCGYCGQKVQSAAPIPPDQVPASAPTIIAILQPIAGRPVGQRGQQPNSAVGSQPRRSTGRLILYGLLIVILTVAIVALLLVRDGTATQSSSSTQPTVTVPAGVPASTPGPLLGIGTAVPNEGNAHVAEGDLVIYRTYPPSSGPHYPATAPYGFSEVEIPEGYFVHSMEHGAVVLYYRPDISNDTRQLLNDLFKKLPQNQNGNVKLVITPYIKGMATPLAIAAWDRLLLMKEYNFDEIRTFYQTWVDKGPEGSP